MNKSGSVPSSSSDRAVFEHSAAPLLVENISGLRRLIRDWQSLGISDIGEYLTLHQGALREALHSVDIVDVNEAAISLYEARDKSELIGPLDKTIDPEALMSRIDLVTAIAAGRQRLQMESTALTLTGKKLDLIVNAHISSDSDPDHTMLVTLIDISERKRLERGASEERRLLHSLINDSPDLFFYKDLEGRFLLVNRALADVAGLRDPADAVGKTDFDLFPRDIADTYTTGDRAVMESMQPSAEIEERIVASDGATRWLLTKKVPITDARGKPIGLLGTARDITARLKMEEKNLRLAALVESSRDAIIGVDRNSLVVSWNKGAEIIYGYSAAEMAGRTTDIFFPPERAEEFRKLSARVDRGESITGFESEAICKDGKRIFISLSLSPIRDARGNVISAVAVSTDITMQKALQARLIRSQRLESLGTLAAGIAHQFNNINTVVKSYLDILSTEKGISTKAREYVEEARKSLERAIDITDRLQGLTSSSPSEPRDVDIEELARALLFQFQKSFEEHGVQVATDFHVARVMADRSMLAFVLRSLLTNSLHALQGRPSRLITISTRSVEGFAALDVADTGCGIPPENLPRIFSPFFTTKGEWAETGSSQAFVKGVGLSLAVSQSAIMELGGRIDVESVPGRGSTFHIWLPSPEGLRNKSPS